MSDTPKDVGVLLKQERERKGISLDVVHEATKVPMDALKAIEEGYRVRTLTAFYYKSFVKIYALYLGLDANAVVALIPTHHPKSAVPVTPVRPGLTRVSPFSGAGAHKVEGVRSWNLLSHPIILKKKKKVFKAVVIVVLATIGIVVLGGLIRKVSMAIAVNHALDKAAKPDARPATKSPVKKASVATVKAEAPKPKAVDAPKPKAVEVEVKAVEEKQVKPLMRVTLTVRAQTSTWISVRVDNVGSFQGHLKKGSYETWRGMNKIELSAKDIGALEFEVNGRNIGKVARRDLKARKLIVTPEGLSVEK